jgi:hypothetical protein
MCSRCQPPVPTHPVSSALWRSLQDPATIFNAVGGATASVAGNPVFGIVHSAFMARTGSAAGAMALMVVPLVCSLLCGTACVTANSRWVGAWWPAPYDDVCVLKQGRRLRCMCTWPGCQPWADDDLSAAAALVLQGCSACAGAASPPPPKACPGLAHVWQLSGLAS